MVARGLVGEKGEWKGMRSDCLRIWVSLCGHQNVLNLDCDYGCMILTLKPLNCML